MSCWQNHSVSWLLIVLAGAALAVVSTLLVRAHLERGIVSVVEDRVVRALRESLHAPVELTLPPGPLLGHMRRRQLPWVELVAEHVPIQDGAAELASVHVRLDGVSLPRRIPGPVTADSAAFTAFLSANDLRTLANLPPMIRSVRVTDDPGLRIFLPGGAFVTVGIRARGEFLELRPPRGSLTSLVGMNYRIALGELPGGARIEQVRAEGELLAVAGPLDGSRLLPSASAGSETH